MATLLELDGNRIFELEKPSRSLADQVELGVTQTAPAGKTIVIEGDPIDHYFRIVSGSVRLYKSVIDGRRQIIDFLGPNECFGLIGLSTHAYSAEAISDVVMIRYSRRRLDDSIEDEPALSNQLFRLACAELDQAQQRMLLLGRKSAEERLASFLIDLAGRQETTNLHLAMSRQDIADYLGLTIETVSRLFTRFKRAGLIDLPDRHSVVVQDGVELADLADGCFAE
ncbi:MAG: Crp/Fnr family transcriptional regulator [Geminicoccaceae bacterium]